MKKLALAAMLGLTLGHAQAEDVLRIFNWNNEIAPDTLKRFEAVCKCKVKEDYYGDNEEMLAKLAAGAKGYDMVVPTTYALHALIKQGKLQPLNKAAIPNLKNSDAGFLKLNVPFDPNNQYGAPLSASVTVLGYQAEKIKALGIPTNSWAALFDPKLLAKIKGKVTVLDSQRELMGAALMYLGKDPNSTTPADWKAAADVIKKAKPYWAAFNNQSYIKELTVGNIWLVHGYSSDFFQAMNDAKAAHRPFNIAYNAQKEGNILGLDNLAILKDAKNAKLANQFINFMNDGKNAADVSNIMGAVNANTVSKANYLKPEIKKNPVIMADPAKEKLFLLQDLDAKSRRELNRIWSEVKAGS